MKNRLSPFAVFALWVLALVWLLPLLGAFLVSLRTLDDLTLRGFWSLPQEITLANYARAWREAGISRYLLNSFIITLPSLVGILVLSSMAAYALVRFRFRLAFPLYLIFLAFNMVPFQMLMLPVFRLANQLGVYDTYLAPILFHTAFQLGFATFVLRNFARTIPPSLFESAVVDGAGEWTIFWRIAWPLMLPGLAAVATLEFTWIFNDFLWGLVLLARDELKPITTGLANLRGQYTDLTAMTHKAPGT
ncbi:carbohydrate ABC transporter permease [Thermus filiformis]|uniref:carbohydrate ABC transporter permease n=1 Tax=Thermus filiformis TaxID=276 RepID=UPI0009E2C074|nr:carbohydrate ABC transporter permease [Thermus filiformis]